MAPAGSYELLVWLIRTSGAPTPVPPAGHPCENAACRGAARSAPAAAIDSEQHSPSDRDLSAQGRRQAGIPADAQHGTGFPEPVPIIARRWPRTGSACKLAIRSERKLAQMFGRTSRRWARARITEARQSP